MHRLLTYRSAMRRRQMLIAGVAGAVLLLATACSEPKKANDFPQITNPPTVVPGQQVNVVASTTQAVDFVRVVGGDRVSLVGLVKPGVDPHVYEPTPQDVQSVARADLIVTNGVGLDQFIQRMLNEAGGGKPVVVMATNVQIRRGSGEGQRDGDPHIWYDPRNVTIMVDNIANALALVDPTGASVYRANANAYKSTLDDLDRRIQEQINTIPKDRRKMVTNHDSYRYYITRYGLEYVGAVIPSLETNAAPSAKQTSDLIRTIQQQRVSAIFADAVVNPKLEEQIAKDAGIKVVATLCADSLTAPGSDCDTYLKMMEHDTKLIVDALK